MTGPAIIDSTLIGSLLENIKKPSKEAVHEIVSKALENEGLTLAETALLLRADDPEAVELIFEGAAKVKRAIYGERLVLFAPLYLSNHCANDCAYCAFKESNPTKRKRLTEEEIKAETAAVIEMGHKRLLLECGEEPSLNSIDYLCGAIETIYSTKLPRGEIRRVNVNIAATGVAEYKRLKAANIGTYQLFQESYHRDTYLALHSGPKADYDRQITAIDRAFTAGIDDVGLGVLFGLFDYRYEVLAMISHARYLEEKFGVGPHTFSVPRLRPAPGVTFTPPSPVSDDELLSIIAILRLSVPYTGMILSTREAPHIRDRALEVGISQASTASAASVGGYSEDAASNAQFELGDTRSMEEFMNEAVSTKRLPSFCTACYRQGRTGHAFMELARPGDIRDFCSPNAILTFKEYLEEFGTSELRRDGECLIAEELARMPEGRLREETIRRTRLIEAGQRDLFF